MAEFDDSDSTQLAVFEAIGLACLNPQSPFQRWDGDCALSCAKLDRSG
jgi:hypothetical protein